MTVRTSGQTAVRLCIESGHPIDPGNYEGPVHCTAHPDGYACATALYERRDDTITTDADRNADHYRKSA